jgi:hypothetical protein
MHQPFVLLSPGNTQVSNLSVPVVFIRSCFQESGVFICSTFKKQRCLLVIFNCFSDFIFILKFQIPRRPNRRGLFQSQPPTQKERVFKNRNPTVRLPPIISRSTPAPATTTNRSAPPFELPLLSNLLELPRRRQ